MKKKRYTEEIHITVEVPDPPKMTWGDLTEEERRLAPLGTAAKLSLQSSYDAGYNHVVPPKVETWVRCHRRDLKRSK